MDLIGVPTLFFRGFSGYNAEIEQGFIFLKWLHNQYFCLFVIHILKQTSRISICRSFLQRVEKIYCAQARHVYKQGLQKCFHFENLHFEGQGQQQGGGQGGHGPPRGAHYTRHITTSPSRFLDLTPFVDETCCKSEKCLSSSFCVLR